MPLLRVIAQVSAAMSYGPAAEIFGFSMRLSAADWAKVTDLFPAPLQSHISALELLAQLLLLWCAFAALPSARGLCQAQLRCDNSGAEACAEKGCPLFAP